jgi:hypothetical protein
MKKWKEAAIKMSNGIEIKVAHTIPTDEETDSAFQNWIIRNQKDAKTKETAERGFAEYIRDKGYEAYAYVDLEE